MGKMLEGLIHVTGEHDTGKTTFALECGADPERILLFDDDVKGRSTIADLKEAGVKFGNYVDLIGLADKTNEYDFHRKVIGLIQGIKKNQYDAIIWDTWSYFSSTCHSYVLKHPNEFRQNWAPMGTIKGAQQWQEARRYEAAILNHMTSVAKTVIVITHLKDFYLGKVKVPHKQVPSASPILDRTSRFRLWLRQNPNGRPVPIGLVLKRLDKKHHVKGVGIRTVSVLPRKIVPADNEVSLWDTIWRYWDEPFGDREPDERELPDNFEISILDSTLTKDQARTMKSLIDAGLYGEPDEEEESEELPQETTDKIVSLHKEGQSAAAIAREVSLPIPKVIHAINNS